MQWHLIGLVMILPLAGCRAPNDFARPGTWQATGVNEANLAAMLADPGHQVRGAAAATDRGQPASLAIRRLELGRRQPLPNSNASRVGVAAGAAPASPEIGNEP